MIAFHWSWATSISILGTPRIIVRSNVPTFLDKINLIDKEICASSVLDAIGSEAMVVAPEEDREMVSHAARLHPQTGGQCPLFLEGWLSNVVGQ